MKLRGDMNNLKAWIYANPFWAGIIIASIFFGSLFLFGVVE
jgi:hypothetical protein